MELCAGGKIRHDQICYESGDCPFCSIIDKSRDEISNLKEEISIMEKKIADLEEVE